MRAVLVAVKLASRAKRRLARFLTPEERIELAGLMFQHVASAISACRLAECRVVVGLEPRLESFDPGSGWEFLAEREQRSESASVDWASAQLENQGVRAVLRLPGDVPLLRARDVDTLLSRPLPCPGALMVPSRDGKGTNALLRTPPTVFEARFGPDSQRLHTAAARRAGVPLVVVRNPRLALDIDAPGDILDLCRTAPDCTTARFLRWRGIQKRIQEGLRGDAVP